MSESLAGSGSAHAKVILVGEHAVVYQVPALAVGLVEGARAHACRSEVARLTWGDSKPSTAVGSPEWLAFAALCAELSTSSYAVEATLRIPSGVGLGASAALGVAIARAIANSEPRNGEQQAAQDRDVLRAADAWERVFHGNPSGIDTQAALGGGCLSFVRGQPPRSIPVAPVGTLLVGVAGPAASTKAMVEKVADFCEQQRARFEVILTQIADLVAASEQALHAGDLALLGLQMRLNHALLQELGTSTPALDGACHLALQAGAHGAKLTGAWGGGAVIALVSAEHAPEVVRSWRARGIVTYLKALGPPDSNATQLSGPDAPCSRD